MSAQVLGLAQLAKSLGAVAKELQAEKAGKISAAIRKRADELADKVRANTPQGPTGNLRRAVESGTFKARPGKPIASFVRISARIAPHAHLVEFGARGGQMPANPFFARSVAGASGLDEIAEAASKAIDEAWK